MSRFASLKAKDVMQTDVVRLSPSDSIESAVATFEEQRIGGAPVVDEAGEVVGVLSASDIAQSAHVRAGRIETERGEYTLPEPYGEELEEYTGEEAILAKEDYSPEVLGRQTVSDWMSPEVISVEPEASLVSVCRTMTNQRIHRVFVLEGRRLAGVITAFDVVRCVADQA